MTWVAFFCGVAVGFGLCFAYDVLVAKLSRPENERG